MSSDPLLQSLPVLLDTKPELFPAADLQDLQQILAPLENNPPENAEQILRDWCKARRPIRDALRNLASDRELKKVRPSQVNQSTRTTNFYQELSQQVKDKLKSESKNPDSSESNG